VRVEELLARARLGIGEDIGYVLGATPGLGAALPQDENGNADCSGFVAWCFGFKKFHPELAWLRRVNGGWLNTDGIFTDLGESTGLFERCAPRPGAVVVYPARWYAQRLDPQRGKLNPTVGHIGIVSHVGPTLDEGGEIPREIRVVHCSAGNARRTGCSIGETDDAVFRRAGVVDYGWHCSLED